MASYRGVMAAYVVWPYGNANRNGVGNNDGVGVMAP